MSVSYFFYYQDGALYDMMSQVDKSLSYILVFSVPNLCIWHTVCMFIIVFCFPLVIKRMRVALNACVWLVAALVVATNGARIGGAINKYLAGGSEMLDVTYTIDTVMEYAIGAITLLICVSFFIIFSAFTRQKKQIGITSVTDKSNSRVILRLALAAVICEVADLSQLVSSNFVDDSWTSYVLFWTLMAIYDIALTLAFTPFKCFQTYQAPGDDFESESILTAEI